MYKTLILACVASLSLAASVDFPKPVVPSDFLLQSVQLNSSTYQRTDAWSVEKYSSKLNKYQLTQSKKDSKGVMVETYSKVTDSNAHSDLEWK